MLRMADRLPADWEIDYEDLGNVYGRARIQSCNACVSTSMALCVWPCNCYEKDNSEEPDLMWDLDLYARLDLADAWAIIGPVELVRADQQPQADVRPPRLHERRQPARGADRPQGPREGDGARALAANGRS